MRLTSSAVSFGRGREKPGGHCIGQLHAILHRLFCFLSALAFVGIAQGAAPVATDDTYVVDVSGTLTVRASFPDTVTAQDPSLYWRFNDTSPNTTSATIDRSDSISSAATHTYASAYGQTGTPTLRFSNGFKGFADTNTWFGFGTEAGTSGYVNSLISPTSGWGSDMGAISFWFKTASSGGDTSDSDDGNKAPDALFAGISAKSSSNKPASYYRTSVLVGLVDGKIIFRVSENDVPIVEFLTTNTYNDSKWHHVVASWDNANDASGFYVDGGSLGGAAKSETMKSFDFDLANDFDFDKDIHVGKGNYGDTVFDGFIDELAIWEHKTLTAENARDLYFSGAGGLLSNDTDADGDALTAIKLTDPTEGTLTFNATGAFTYDSTGASYGPKTFTYKVNDGGSDSNVATVTLASGRKRKSPVQIPTSQPFSIHSRALSLARARVGTV